MTRPVPPPGLAARYAFICPRCDEPGGKGDRIVYRRTWPGQPVHVRCASGADDE